MKTAKILIFSYKRLEPLKLTIEALKKNTLSARSDIYIFSDGPKNETDVEHVKNVRAYLKTITHFKTVTIKESARNRWR